MRTAAFGATLLLLFTGCSTTTSGTSYQKSNDLMTEEITRRVDQIPFQHRDELLENLLWFAQTGEQTIPAMLKGLKSENPKVRSSCAWVLGRLRDRRTIPDLQRAAKDEDLTVRMECARTLLLMGDLAWTPTLIEGLDNERKEVRYMSHEALKSATGHDFGYDHLNQNQNEMRLSVLRWRQWWSEYSGDTFFAQQYQQEHNLTPAAPQGETQPGKQEPAPKSQPGNTQSSQTNTPNTSAPATGTAEAPITTTEPGTDAPAQATPTTTKPAAPGTGTTTKPAATGTGTATKPAAPGTKPATKPGTTPAPGTTTVPPADETTTTPPATGTSTTPTRQPGSANSTSSTTTTTTPPRK